MVGAETSGTVVGSGIGGSGCSKTEGRDRTEMVVLLFLWVRVLFCLHKQLCNCGDPQTCHHTISSRHVSIELFHRQVHDKLQLGFDREAQLSPVPQRRSTVNLHDDVSSMGWVKRFGARACL